jgi:ribonucleoside-diphosphate reductase beta chain
VYIKDDEERDKLLNAVDHIPCVAEKIKWAEKWIHSNESLAHRLIAYIIVEMIQFSGCFAGIFWLKEQNKCPNGLITSNELIVRDEGLHANFGCLLYTNYVKDEFKLSQKEFESILSEAVNAEIVFITESLPCTLAGINAKSMSNYIKYIANRLAKQLNYIPLYDVKEQPFPFMTQLGLMGKTNFFEKRVTEYGKSSKNNEDAYDDLDKIV